MQMHDLNVDSTVVREGVQNILICDWSFWTGLPAAALLVNNGCSNFPDRVGRGKVKGHSSTAKHL
jgi:hypothetical protein